MGEAGIDSVRLPMFWAGIEPKSPASPSPTGRASTSEVELAAEAAIRVMPFVWGSPAWVAAEADRAAGRRPPGSAGLGRASSREAARRYGPDGEFWEDHTKLPSCRSPTGRSGTRRTSSPQADDPNPAEYAKLIRISGRTLHAVDPGSKVLDRRPLRPAAADPAQRRLRRLPQARLRGRQRQALLRRCRPAPLRRRRQGDGRPAEQPAPDHAAPRRRADAALRDRARLGLAQRPDPLGARPATARPTSSRSRSRCSPTTGSAGTCAASGGSPGPTKAAPAIFCGSAGLLTEAREAKPSWYRFIEWTGGDPGSGPAALRRRSIGEDGEYRATGRVAEGAGDRLR